MHNTAEALAKRAQEQRQLGHYNRATLRLFFKAWRRNPSPANLIQWLGFQRDLGYSLRQHQYRWLHSAIYPLWRSWLKKCLPYRLLQQGRKLCQEYEFTEGKAETPANPLASMWRQEEQWRTDFLSMIVTQKEGGIAIVGNGARLNGAGLGEQIDQHRFVLRFNRFTGANSTREDNGIKLDIWVRAPDYVGPAPRVDWLLMTGPAIQFKLQNWRPLKPLIKNGAKLVCVPLSAWRDLVAELGAPPSGGLLVAYWLAQQPGLKPHLRLFGFGFEPENGEVYHQGVPGHQPNDRHNWQGERVLLKQWFGENLV